MRPCAAYWVSSAEPKRCASTTVYLELRAARTSAWRCASVGPAALRAVFRTGLVSRCATGSAEPGEVELRPP